MRSRLTFFVLSVKEGKCGLHSYSRSKADQNTGTGFISDFLNKVRDDHKTEIFAVGEFFVSDVSMLEDYLNKFDGTVCLFDTP